MASRSSEAAAGGPQADAQDRIHSVAMAFRILEAVAAIDYPIGVSEIARSMGEQKARIQRHLVTLKALGALSQDHAGKYRLGWKLVEFGQKAIAQFDLVELAERDVKDLRDKTSLTCALALVSGRGLRIAYVAESAEMMTVTVRTGLAVPLHGSAAGRLLLAHGEPGDAAAEEGPPARGRQKGAADPVRIAAIRKRGYEYSVGEIATGVHSLAAPVLGPDGQMLAALVCVGTHTQITEPPPEELVRAVRHFAHRIAARLKAGTG